MLVFVDGEFWHGYDWENVKKQRIHTNRDYWIPKLERNMERDQEVNQKLKDMGYTVIRFWEKHEVLKDMDGCVNQVLEAIEHNKKQMKKEK